MQWLRSHSLLSPDVLCGFAASLNWSILLAFEQRLLLNQTVDSFAFLAIVHMPFLYFKVWFRPHAAPSQIFPQLLSRHSSSYTCFCNLYNIILLYKHLNLWTSSINSSVPIMFKPRVQLNMKRDAGTLQWQQESVALWYTFWSLDRTIVFPYNRRRSLTIAGIEHFLSQQSRAIAISHNRWVAGKCFHKIVVDRSGSLGIDSDHERLYGNQVLLNKRTKLISKCRHGNKFYANNAKLLSI